MFTRCCSPPEKVVGLSDQSRSGNVQWLQKGGGLVPLGTGVFTQCQHRLGHYVQRRHAGHNVQELADIAQRSAPLRRVTFLFWNRIWPSVGSASRLTIRSSVDLPAPEAPMMPNMQGRSTEMVTLSTARLSPKALVRFVICSTSPPSFRGGI